MNSLMKTASFFSAIYLTGFIFATGIKAPVSLPNAGVLPKGVRNITYKGVFTNPDAKYSDGGNSVDLADPFFKDITVGNAVSGKVDPVERSQLQNAANAAGLSDEDSFGSTTGAVNLAVRADVPVVAYGITEKLTAAIVIPITSVDIKVDAGVIQKNSENHQKIRDALAAMGASTKIAEFDEKMLAPTNEKLKEYGYDDLYENEGKSTKLGDIRLISKYNFEAQQGHTFSGLFGVTLPTGKRKDINKVVQVSGGDSQIDLEAGVNYDYAIFENFKVMTSFSHTVQLKDESEERVPFQADSKLSPYIDNNVERNLGDISKLELGTSLRVFDQLTLASAYSFQYKDGDSYSGTKYASWQYDLLGNDTVQRMSSVHTVISYDTIGLFRKKQFVAPLAANLGWTKVFSGKNVVSNDVVTADISLFF